LGCLYLLQDTGYIQLVLGTLVQKANTLVRWGLQIQNFLQSSVQSKNQFQDQLPPLHSEANLFSIEPEQELWEVPVVENTSEVLDARVLAVAMTGMKKMMNLIDGAFFTPEIFSLGTAQFFSRCPFARLPFEQTRPFAQTYDPSPKGTHGEFQGHLQAYIQLLRDN
jgi:hypothetical protein